MSPAGHPEVTTQGLSERLQLRQLKGKWTYCYVHLDKKAAMLTELLLWLTAPM